MWSFFILPTYPGIAADQLTIDTAPGGHSFSSYTVNNGYSGQFITAKTNNFSIIDSYHRYTYDYEYTLYICTDETCTDTLYSDIQQGSYCNNGANECLIEWLLPPLEVASGTDYFIAEYITTSPTTNNPHARSLSGGYEGHEFWYKNNVYTVYAWWYKIYYDDEYSSATTTPEVAGPPPPPRDFAIFIIICLTIFIISVMSVLLIYRL